VMAQVTILLALANGLLDEIPLDRIPQAEQSLAQAAAGLPDELCARILTARSLLTADREAILMVLHDCLARFAEDSAADQSIQSQVNDRVQDAGGQHG